MLHWITATIASVQNSPVEDELNVHVGAYENLDDAINALNEVRDAARNSGIEFLVEDLKGEQP